MGNTIQLNVNFPYVNKPGTTLRVFINDSDRHGYVIGPHQYLRLKIKENQLLFLRSISQAS